MSICIKSNIASLRAQRNLSSAFAKLSSGKRIVHSSEEAGNVKLADSLIANNRLLQVTLGAPDRKEGELSSAFDKSCQVLTTLQELCQESQNKGKTPSSVTALLQETVTNLAIVSANLSSAQTKLQDVNFVSEASELTRLSVLDNKETAGQTKTQSSLALSLLL